MFTNDQLEMSALPKVEDLDMHPIHPNYLYILIFNISITFLSVASAVIVVRIFSDDKSFNTFSNYLFVILAIFYLISFLLYFLGFKNRKYAMREKDMTYMHGYLVTKTVTLPYNRIQHIEIERSFLARKLGLSTLKIYSAGEAGGDLAIKGLPKDVADGQYAFLTKVINER